MPMGQGEGQAVCCRPPAPQEMLMAAAMVSQAAGSKARLASSRNSCTLCQRGRAGHLLRLSGPAVCRGSGDRSLASRHPGIHLLPAPQACCPVRWHCLLHLRSGAGWPTQPSSSFLCLRIPRHSMAVMAERPIQRLEHLVSQVRQNTEEGLREN